MCKPASTRALLLGLMLGVLGFSLWVSRIGLARLTPSRLLSAWVHGRLPGATSALVELRDRYERAELSPAVVVEITRDWPEAIVVLERDTPIGWKRSLVVAYSQYGRCVVPSRNDGRCTTVNLSRDSLAQLQEAVQQGTRNALLPTLHGARLAVMLRSEAGVRLEAAALDGPMDQWRLDQIASVVKSVELDRSSEPQVEPEWLQRQWWKKTTTTNGK